MENKYKKKTITYNKLIRDKIPEIIIKDQGSPKLRIADKKEFPKFLKAKILEEAQEISEAKSSELKKELADIFQALYSLLEELDIPKEEIEQIRKERLKKRGGFEKRIILEKVIRNTIKGDI